MILVIGGIADSVTELVCARLAAAGDDFHLLDLGRYPLDTSIEWTWHGGGLEGCLSGRDWSCRLGDLQAVFARFPGVEARTPPAGLPHEEATCVHGELDIALSQLIDDLPCLVVNRSTGGMSNCSKPYQALLVRRCGLLTPDTLVSNDPQAVADFVDACAGDVIYKSLSGVRSIVRRLTPALRARLPLLANGPAQFQAFVPGENVRVHTVGDEVYATRIVSDATDYRYAAQDGHKVHMVPCTLPAEVAQACLRLARELDLPLTGIDLKRTPQGAWYCFEVNPAPGFIYFERHSGQPISAALASLLRHGGGWSAPEGRQDFPVPCSITT